MASNQATSESLPIIALLGNPNAGKTSVFNMLTGSHRQVANYPGVTVEKASGIIRHNSRRLEVLDLPGAYSLTARSPDEFVVTEILLGHRDDTKPLDAAVVVIDATNIERNLFLATQVLEAALPTIIALNMTDIAERRGIKIDSNKLAQKLGVPVIPIVASTGKGREALIDAIEKSIGGNKPAPICDWPDAVNESVGALSDEIARLNGDVQPMTPYEVRRCILDANGELERRLVAHQKSGSALADFVYEERKKIEAAGFSPANLEAEIRYACIAGIVGECVQRSAKTQSSRSERLDNLLTHRVLGTIIFGVVMTVVFISVFSWAAPLMDAVEGVFATLSGWVQSSLGEGILATFLTDGVIGGVGSVLVFLPQIMILIALITLLEDCGYLARAAFLMDRVLRLFGLGGRGFVPLLSSFACAIPGVMATRTIECPRERLITILIAPLMACSARIPVYTIFVAAFIPQETVLGFLPLQGLVFAGMYFFGIIAAAVAALVFKSVLAGRAPTPFILELPSYKMPSIKLIMLRSLDRAKVFIQSAGTIILAMSIIIWALLYFPRPAQTETKVRADMQQAGITEPKAIDNAIAGEYLRNSYMGRTGKAIEPVVKPLGWDWKIGMATLASFPAREVVVSTLGIIYNLGDAVDEESTVLRKKLQAATWPDGRKVYNIPVVLSIMVFFALCCQCGGTVAVIKRETNSWKWATVAFSYMTILAYVGALVVYQVGIRIS
ncbi:MAG: ferrous iron transport protein B [Phycisphaerae bacterium]|nr:MAG: ferrous iron transport protein B [Phycisphaerae bacterium]